MKLSIIIPVYNVDKYLSKCLDSCLNQNISTNNYEIICVNDGSTDSSKKILKSYSEIYSNIKVISQTNKGLSEARNNGLSLAEGEYIWFVDSDDSIVSNSLKEILISLEQNPDLLQLNHQDTFEDGKHPILYIEKQWKAGISGKELLKKTYLPVAAPFTIYKKQLLDDNNLRFMPNILHEDSEFKPRVTFYAKSIMWHNPIVYNYLQRFSGSITSNFKLRNALSLITVIQSLHSFYQTNVTESLIRIRFKELIGLNLNNILNGLYNLHEEERNIVVEKIKENSYIFHDMMTSCNIKYYIEGNLMKLSIRNAIVIHNLFQKFRFLIFNTFRSIKRDIVK